MTHNRQLCMGRTDIDIQFNAITASGFNDCNASQES
jgi:hypothetical protein